MLGLQTKWRRCVLDDEAADELKPLQGQLASAGGSAVPTMAGCTTGGPWRLALGLSEAWRGASWRVLERGRVCGMALQ